MTIVVDDAQVIVRHLVNLLLLCGVSNCVQVGPLMFGEFSANATVCGVMFRYLCDTRSTYQLYLYVWSVHLAILQSRCMESYPGRCVMLARFTVAT